MAASGSGLTSQNNGFFVPRESQICHLHSLCNAKKACIRIIAPEKASCSVDCCGFASVSFGLPSSREACVSVKGFTWDVNAINALWSKRVRWLNSDFFVSEASCTLWVWGGESMHLESDALRLFIRVLFEGLDCASPEAACKPYPNESRHGSHLP